MAEGRHTEEVVRYLELDVLKHVIHLKMLALFPSRVETHFVERGGERGVMLCLPSGALGFDVSNYGRDATIVLPVSKSPEVLAQLVRSVRGERVVFKLVGSESVEVLSALFPIRLARRFLNFTSVPGRSYREHSAVRSSAGATQGLVDAFAENSYTSEEVRAHFSDGARALSIEEHGETISAGLAFRNFRNVWEIAALFTRPEARRRGLAKRIVETALASFHDAGRTPRYVVNSENEASVKLARQLGLRHFATVAHYVSTASHAGS